MSTFTTTTPQSNGPSIPAIDFNKSLGEVDLIISLSARLADRKEFAAICIKNAIKSPMSCGKIIDTVRDMITDNRLGMETILGANLVNRVTNGI